MIKEFFDSFIKNKDELVMLFAENHPSDYKELVTNVLRVVHPDVDNGISLDEVHEICPKGHPGGLLYIFHSHHECESRRYWYVKVDYGSCSACDTLLAIKGESYDTPLFSQIEQYMTLALHVVQGIKEMV